MYSTQVTFDNIMSDVLYNYIHENVTKIDISRNYAIFTIENKERTIIVKEAQPITSMAYNRPEYIVYRVNKIANWINKVPDHIPKEHTVKWIECKINRRNYEMYSM